MTSIYLFTRDLRIIDNTGLIRAFKESDKVIPIFIYNNDQLKEDRAHSIKFMVESLIDLSKNIHLNTYHDESCISMLIKKYNVKCIYMNEDYTQYARKRVDRLKKYCKVIESRDYLLSEPIDKRYAKFTPFYNRVIGNKVRPIDKYKIDKLKVINDVPFSAISYKHVPSYVTGGRVRIDLSKFNKYEQTRDYPYIPTTYLGPYIKFGVYSIREVYNQISNKELIRQLYWRDFFTLLEHKPVNYTWKGKGFEKWCEGRTGIPIVDAGMRQLNKMGWMHNRVRMITANYLTNILDVDWKKGEYYFSLKLVDYDPLVNTGNWMWQANVGAQSRRVVFNTWRQSKRFDPDCIYMREWVEEIRNKSNKEIHDMNKIESN